MRQYKQLFDKFLRKYICNYRKKKNLSQEDMAEILCETPRSYIDQEHGKYGFSGLTVMFFMLELPEEEILLFISQFREDLHKEENRHGDVS